MKNLSTYPADQFHQRRMKGIGGSDISAIMGVNPWKSPLDVYLDKVGESEPLQDNFPMRLGRAMEVTLRESFAELHESFIEHSTDDLMMIFEDGIFYHHPDGVIENLLSSGLSLLWEAKSSSRYGAWKVGPPPEVIAQCQWGLMISELPKCVVSLSLGSREYREFEILPDKSMWAEMAMAASKFWECNVLLHDPPDPSGSDSDRVWLDEAFDESETVAPLSPTLVELGARRISEDTILKEYQGLRDETDQMIMKEMADHSAAAGDNFKVIWKRPKDRKTLDKKLLREVMFYEGGLSEGKIDNIMEQATVESEQKRRFLFKEVDNAS